VSNDSLSSSGDSINNSNHELLASQTGLTRQCRLSGQLNYTERNHIEKWFQTVSMRIDRFYSLWQGSQSSARRWLRRFRHHYKHDRPNQALDNQMPTKVVLNYTVLIS